MKNDDTDIKMMADVYNLLEVPEDKFVELDLGCGKGRFTVELAQMYPDRFIIAVDVLIGRLRKLSNKITRLNIENMKLLKCDAWQLISHCFRDYSLNRVHFLCPDPWPKEKQRHNRLVSSEFVGRIYNKLRFNGTFHFSSDDKNYFKYVNTVFANSGMFEIDNERIDDVSQIKTDFELLWNEMGLPVNHIAWRKLL